MEKYGVDMSDLPATDDQIRQLRKLCKEANVDFKLPKNRQEAQDLIEKIAGETE
jgi:hypothetical protein